jgi:hypothetical protein
MEPSTGEPPPSPPPPPSFLRSDSHRVVCSTIVLFPAHRQYPARDCLRNAIGECQAFSLPLSHCCRRPRHCSCPRFETFRPGALLASRDVPLRLPGLHQPVRLSFLCALFALLTPHSTFLENALLISAPAATAALQHVTPPPPPSFLTADQVCQLSGTREVIKVCLNRSSGVTRALGPHHISRETR